MATLPGETQPVPQAFPAREQAVSDLQTAQARREPVTAPQPTEAQQQAMLTGVAQPESEIQPIGEPGTVLRGATSVVAGVLNRPEYLAAMLNPATAAAVGARFLPEVAKQFTEDLGKAAQGDNEALGRAAAIGIPALIGGVKAGRTITERLNAQVALETAQPATPPMATAEALLPRAAAAAKATEAPPPEVVAEPSTLVKPIEERTTSASEITPPANEDGNLFPPSRTGEGQVPVEEGQPRVQLQTEGGLPAQESDAVGWDKVGEIRRNHQGDFERVENGQIIDTASEFEHLMLGWDEGNAGYDKRIVETSPGKFELFLRDRENTEESPPVNELIPYDSRTRMREALPPTPIGGKEGAQPAEETTATPPAKVEAGGAPPADAAGAGISAGPGAAASGEPGTYSAIKQLSDKMRTTPSESVKEGISMREKMADRVVELKGAATRVLARGRAIAETIKGLRSGLRDFNEVDRRVADLDYALQRSAGLSREAQRALIEGVKNDATREGMAIWIDAAGDEAAIRDTLANLPSGTNPRVKRALESALNLPEDVKTHAAELSDYFAVRAEEAINEGIFSNALEDYFTHVWKTPDNMPDSVKQAINTGRVNEYFKFSRQRKIPTLLEGILQGREPVLDPASVIPHYNYLLDRAIASRHFIKSLEELNAEDGRPVLAAVGTRSEITDPYGAKAATLIKLRVAPESASDYRSIDHPALRKWKWAAMDENGKPVFYEGDLRVHPEHFERIARMMDRSRLTPSKLGKALLRASTEVKGFKLGVASLFHPVQVGTHALFHWTKPWVSGELDWDSAPVKFAIQKGGLQLAGSPAQMAHFSEGILTPGLVNKLPWIGPLSRALSEWTFQDYIPRLKLQTFEKVYQRDLKRYGKDLTAGKITEEQVAARAGDAVNNAFGELNQLWLGKWGRDPRFQRILRGIFLAPDFGEARLRFVSKAATKYGGEERLALATAFIGLYLGARAANALSHGDAEVEDWHHAFDVKVGDRWWGVRSIVGDLNHLFTKPRQFWEVRLNPLYARTALALLSGRDPRGHKFQGMTDFAADIGKQFVPIHMGALTRDDQKLWESFVQSIGAQTWRASAVTEIHRVARDWREKKGIKDNTEILPGVDSPYRKARVALEFGDESAFQKAIDDLERQREDANDPHPRKTIESNFKRYYNAPFAGNKRLESDFKASLSARHAKIYKEAEEERAKLYDQFKDWF